MKKSIVAILLIASGVAHAQAPNMKPGLWETRIIHQILDGKDMSAQLTAAQARMQEAMARMSPEQRKQMESYAKTMGMPGQGTGTGIRTCISPAMAAKHIATTGDPEGHCQPASINSSGGRTTFSFNCTKEGRTTVGSGESTFSGDTISSHIDVKTTDSRGSHTVQADTQMTYLGADCQGIKPVDELAREAQAR